MEIKRTSNGRFAKGQSANLLGGVSSFNKRFRALMELYGDDILTQLFKSAREGDPAALKMVCDKGLIVPKLLPVKVELPESDSLENISKGIKILISKMADGTLTGEEVKPFLEAFDAQFKAIERVDIIPQIEELKKIVNQTK